MALLLVVYLLLLGVGLFFGLGGFGAAAVAVETGEGEAIARATLTGLMISAVMTSLVFGVGPRAAFADAVLRRYPLSALERLTARHLVGLIDPIWFLLAAMAVGMALGMAWLGAGSLIWGLAAAALYIVICYLMTIFLLSLLDRVLQTAAGAAILGAVALTAFSLSGLFIPWLIEQRDSPWFATVDEVLRWLPSGLSAAPMTGAGTGESLASLAALIAWGLLLLLLTGLAEGRSVSSTSSTGGTIDWENIYDRVASLGGRYYAPLIGKALRYNLRSNRVRFGLASAPLFAIIGRFMTVENGANGEFYFTLALFMFLGFSGPSSVTLNQFGSDGAGVRRYALLPVPLAAAVRAGSLAAMGLGLLVIPPTIALWALITRAEVEWRMIAMQLGGSLAGLLLFNAASMWTTILSPRRVDFTSMLGNQLSIGGNAVVIVGMLAIFAVYFGLLVLRAPIESVLFYWWLPWALAAFAFAIYLFSWMAIGQAADAQRDRIVKTIAE